MTNCNCQKWHPSTGCSEARDADEMGNPIEMVDCQHYQPLTCAHCGHTGQDVERKLYYLGGKYDWFLECINRQACWTRWNAQYKEGKEYDGGRGETVGPG